MHKEELTDGQSLRGFALATIAFLAIFAATAIPIPLYADYQATIGLTTADISNTMFTYLTGVALTLLLAGRISDAFGRTPVTSLTLMLAIVGCIMFMMADSGAAVLAARFVQGLSAGFGMSAVSALVIDCVGERHLGWGSTVASCGAMVGIMIGSVAVGILYDIVPSIAVLYGIMIVILAVCLFLMPVVHEPLDQTLSLRAVMRVRVYIPTDNRAPGSPWWPCATWPPGSSPASTSRSRRPSPSSASARPRLWPGRSFWPSSWRRRFSAAPSCSASSPSAPSSSPWRP